ncbi:MAG: MucR family transcriptional regulator, partial [Actinobacteria bacterium]|nr:MucR family transcriptional regulator [Actinomycetota bacterium]
MHLRPVNGTAHSRTLATANHLPTTTGHASGWSRDRTAGGRSRRVGRFGVVDETADGLLCHECGRRFIHLGLHVYKAHGVTANEYRVAHGLRRRGLVVAPTAEVIA